MEIVCDDQIAQAVCAERRDALIGLIHTNLGLVAAATVHAGETGVLVIDTGVGSLKVKDDLSGVA
jgi:hypothetical protein